MVTNKAKPVSETGISISLTQAIHATADKQNKLRKSLLAEIQKEMHEDRDGNQEDVAVRDIADFVQKELRCQW